MGVYIKDMQMPTRCIACHLNYDSCACILTGSRFYKYDTEFDPGEERLSDCPLILIPPHGDLIDRDEIRKTIKPWSPEDEMNGCTFDTVKKLMHTMISRASVVIPAEEGE